MATADVQKLMVGVRFCLLAICELDKVIPDRSGSGLEQNQLWHVLVVVVVGRGEIGRVEIRVILVAVQVILVAY